MKGKIMSIVITEDRKKELLEIAEERLNDILSDAVHELGQWDDLLEEDTISSDEFRFISDNLIFEYLEVSFRD